MPKIWHNTYYYWSRKETAQHNTERHQVFREELYPCASLSREEFLQKLEDFKEKNFDLLDSEKVVASYPIKGVKPKSVTGKMTSIPTSSKLNNKLEG